MSSDSALCDGVELGSLDTMERYVSILVWKRCLSVEFGFLSILLIMAYAPCCSLQGVMKIMVIVHG